VAIVAAVFSLTQAAVDTDGRATVIPTGVFVHNVRVQVRLKV
jgi:hypothetical protein